MAQTTTKATEQAQRFLGEARAAGFKIELNGRLGDLVTITKTFGAGDSTAYITTDSDASRILSLAPMLYPGTVWGSDSASVGGHAALTTGQYRMSKSGVSKRFVNALRKAL